LGGKGKGKPASPQDESVVACGGLESVRHSFKAEVCNPAIMMFAASLCFQDYTP